MHTVNYYYYFFLWTEYLAAVTDADFIVKLLAMSDIESLFNKIPHTIKILLLFFFPEDIMDNYIAENDYISVFIYHLLFVIQTLKCIYNSSFNLYIYFTLS